MNIFTKTFWKFAAIVAFRRIKTHFREIKNYFLDALEGIFLLAANILGLILFPFTLWLTIYIKMKTIDWKKVDGVFKEEFNWQK